MAANPLSMLALEMLSYAPTPSMERTVLVGRSSVKADNEWTTASVPALVDKANWKGLHVVWKCVEKVCAIVRYTTLRSRSPTTNPRTPPYGFCKATMRPSPMAGTICGGTMAVARRFHTSAKRAVVSSSSKTMRRVSGVRPGGPAATPFHVFRRAVTSFSVARWSGGAVVSMAGGDQDPGGWPRSMDCQVLGGRLSELVERLIVRLCGPDVVPALPDVCQWVLLWRVELWVAPWHWDWVDCVVPTRPRVRSIRLVGMLGCGLAILVWTKSGFRGPGARAFGGGGATGSMLVWNLFHYLLLLFAPMRSGGPPGIFLEGKKVVFGIGRVCPGGWQTNRRNPGFAALGACAGLAGQLLPCARLVVVFPLEWARSLVVLLAAVMPGLCRNPRWCFGGLTPAVG
eukprot:s884_g8.t1